MNLGTRKVECVGGPLCGNWLVVRYNQRQLTLTFVRPRGISSAWSISDSSPLVVDPPPTSPMKMIETYRGTYLLVQWMDLDCGVQEELWWDGEI